MRGRLESALRDVHDALSKRDAVLATTHAEALKGVLPETGGTLYAPAT
jgi:hypothetical protein